ncbi:Ppx/GppA phosphatase family protein [Marinimicrococcus flavescens]|uniref:Ppx/GppA phosphatase family protein n=1 Tax=Marinimicrococcus flavescens TaxID=3031815 RepID=A0AAP3UX81_9PROT|nr:Ppx/GppA phosphatase family protein [Marinimicrococcus flavescens]
MDMLAAADAAVAPPPSPRVGTRLAALDLGTNNCRLLVAEVRGDGFEVIDSFSRIVRLGEGLARTERLSDPAMARTLTALKVCGRIIARHRVAGARCVATEACRRAANGREFLQRVQRVTGLELEVLRQEDEARLAMLGCLPLLDPDARQLLVIDIGGGSTEILWLDRSRPGEGGEPGTALSLPLGVVTLSETFGHEVGEETFAAMVEHVHERLMALHASRPLPRLADGAALQMLGTSGTVTTLAAVHLGLRRYDRRKVDGLCLSFAAVKETSDHLRMLDHATRAANPCIGAGRADLVVAGCAILEAIHRQWPVDQLCVADRGVREGILATLMGRNLHQLLDGAEDAA